MYDVAIVAGGVIDSHAELSTSQAAWKKNHCFLLVKMQYMRGSRVPSKNSFVNFFVFSISEHSLRNLD